MNKQPLFSISTPCWNSAKTIERTIKSVLAQKFKDYEYIIVDGGSTDGTLDIIKKYEPLFEGRMHWKSEPDKGLYDAFNKGIERSTGLYCWNVNSDDFIESDALIELSEIIKTISNDTVIVGSMYLVDESGEKKKLVLSSKENTEKAYKMDYMINHAATVVPKSIYEKYGVFDDRFKICADLDWFHRCYKNNVKFFDSKKILTNFSLGGISTSSIYKKERNDKWLYFNKNYNFFSAICKFIKWHKTYFGEKRRINKNRKMTLCSGGGLVSRVLRTLNSKWVKRNSSSYIKYLRSQGIAIGDECVLRSPGSTRIDLQRPELITIGNNVDMNKNFQILTHDWGSSVFRTKFHDFINSTGKVIIGNNIYFGTDVIVLKGVSIGDNCIIGAGSIVTKSIPANSVATGAPCKVVCTLEEYYEKRKNKALQEAVERVNCFRERFGRAPLPKELREEFIYYVNKDNAEKYEAMGVPIRWQLAEAYDDWMEKHTHSQFPNFEAFLDYCYKNKV